MGFDEFDEEEYLRANPDVAVMVERGLFRSPLDHWQRSGSLEHSAGRRRSGFYEHDRLYDEQTYLRTNPDVLALVKKRMLGSGYEHWMRHGRVEFARGKRHAPFVAHDHVFRPFRVSFGEHGGLLVGAAPDTLRPDVGLFLEEGDKGRAPMASFDVGVTAPLRLLDALRREVTLRLLVVRLPPLGADARRPRPLVLSTANGEAVLVSRDLGMQAFFFARAEDAREFLRCALALGAPAAERPGAFGAALTDFVVGRLQCPPGARDPYTAFFLEALEPREGEGFAASGWLAPPGDGVARVSVWCPESDECVDADALVRVDRPDVLATLASVPGASSEAALGFRTLLRLPALAELSRSAPGRLIFGVTLHDGSTRFFETRDAS
ncbi:MAG TPA: hypothetical protein VH062_16250 [Polyangiaceae bacterium]|nr:hypothetical protein [Polyangiaceae bacterium]